VKRGWSNTTLGMILWGTGAGILTAVFNWPFGAAIAINLMGVPFILFMFGKEE